MEWATTERKKEMQRSVNRRPNRTAQLQEKKGRREGKIRKEYCIHQSKHTQAGGWFSMFTLSQLAKHSSMPPARLPSPCPHAADEHLWEASWTWRTMGFDLLTDTWVHSCLLSHTNKSHSPGCQSQASSSHPCLKSQCVRGGSNLVPPLCNRLLF